jgi:1-deoxy-D-xylulose-5-phosphate synthase
MREGSGLGRFEKEFPERYFDVGIAEQHAVTFAAGLAADGMKPVIAIYSTFLQRGYDQLIHDVAIQNLDVTFALDRGGLVGNDGATHHGAFDLSYLRCIPNLVVMAASDENECRQMLTTAFRHEGPSAVRYPRGTGPGIAIRQELEGLPIGVGEIKRETQREVARETAEHGRGRIAILAFGSMVTPALAAAEMLEATVANMRFVKPVDAALIGRLAATHDALVTVEENTVMGGAGSAVAEAMATLGLQKPLLMLGLPDHFIDHGDTAKLLASVGLDAAGIERAVRERFADLAGGERRFKSVA